MSISITQTALPSPCLTKTFMAFMPCTVYTAAGKGGCSWAACSRTSGRHSAGTVQREDLLADTRFSTPEARQAKDEALAAEISAVLAERTADEWEELLTEADVGCVRADEALEGDFYADHPPRQGE